MLKMSSRFFKFELFNILTTSAWDERNAGMCVCDLVLPDGVTLICFVHQYM